MPIAIEEWPSITAAISKAVSKIGTSHVQGKVVKRDVERGLIYMNEFGAQPVAMVGFDYEVKYYDTQPDGTVEVKKVIVKPMLPKVGQTVLVAKLLGSRRIPRLIGVIQARDYVVPTKSDVFVDEDLPSV
jgi:hypothetical protein